MEATLTRHRFRAMGTDVELLVESPDAARAVAAAEAEFHRLEALLTRFRPESELSRLNAAGSLTAGPDLLRVVELAVAARERTGGRFDINVHDALLAAGYDRSFELLSADDVRPAHCSPLSRGRVEIAADVISLRGGAQIDLGGIGKGYACERSAEILATAGPCLVNAGGDIATRDGVWTISVETPEGPLALELSGGCALATSGRDSRRWRRAGRELHHIIDPATGAPSASDLLRVTVVARDAVDAEVTAKSLFLAGSDAARTEADELAIPTVLVTADGRTITAGGLA